MSSTECVAFLAAGLDSVKPKLGSFLEKGRRTRIFAIVVGQELPLCPEFLGGAAAPP